MWILVVLILALFYRPLTTETFFFRDLYQLFYPKKEFLVAALRSGQIPLWDPLTNGGQPFLASPTNTPFYPSNLLFFILPFRAAFNVDLVLHVVFCAVAAYWLARTLRFSPAAAFVSGAGFALCGYAVSAINLSLPIHALPWIPLTIGLLQKGSPIAAGIAASMPIFAGSAELTAMLFVTMIAWRRARASLLAIGIAIGLALVQIIPAAQVIANSSRSHRRTYEAFTMWSVDPRRLPELIVPQFFGPTGTLADQDYWGRLRESQGFPYILSIYFGIPLLLLAVSGATVKDDEFPSRMLAALALAGLILSIGKFLPGFRLIYELPFVATFRYPVKFLMIALLPIALLAGRGVEAMRGRVWAAAAGLVAAAFGAAIFVSGNLTSIFYGLQLTDMQRYALAGSALHATIAALLLTAALHTRKKVAVAAVVMADLFVAALPVNVYAPRTLFDEPVLARHVREIVGPMRFYHARSPVIIRAPSNDVFWLARRNLAVLAGYTATMFGIATIFHTDYDGLAPEAISRLSERMEDLPWPQRLPLLRAGGVRAFVTADVVSGVIEVSSDPPLHLYAIPSAALAWFEGPCAATEVRATNRLTYAVSAPCDGRVIFAETDYPGWRVTVDGNSVPIERANVAFSAVRVARGGHTIVRSYRPWIWTPGVAGTALTILALIVFAFRSYER